MLRLRQHSQDGIPQKEGKMPQMREQNSIQTKISRSKGKSEVKNATKQGNRGKDWTVAADGTEHAKHNHAEASFPNTTIRDRQRTEGTGKNKRGYV
jgi:hypothetical protein